MVKKGIIGTNPLILIPKPKLPPRFPKALQEKELIELLQTVTKLPSKYSFNRNRNIAIITTFIYTGLRKSELLNLQSSDVDIDNGFIFVKEGKGMKSREIPIEQSTLRPILEEFIIHRERLGRYDGYFFCGTWSEKCMGYSVLDRLFKELSYALKKRIHAHKLRHTFATLVLDKTGDIYTLQQLMGHSDIKTTTIYLNSTRKRKTEAINSLKLFEKD
jgi:site-specific recombinase XerD